ncbi:MAG TPA: AAA family ATPase [Longimicrobiales bacterium]|nr:AAA family ATPase [Longimicrobiales bacterium]
MTTPLATDGKLPRELPLVGRRAELEQLFGAFGAAAAASQVRVITGEAGVGKSRLARTLAAEATRRGWRVLVGRAFPVEQGVPYAVMADAFVHHLREMDTSSLTVLARGREGDLRRLFPALGDEGVTQEEGLEPEELRTRLFWTFSSVLKGVARRQPILVVLEDLHWADPSSLALLHFLARQLEGADLRFVATSTAEERERNPDLLQLERSLESLDRLERLDLAPLELGATEQLLKDVFGMAGPPVSDFAQRLYGWTRGNAYFLEQTLQALVQQGQLYQQDGTWLGWESPELILPSTVRDAILARFQGLDALARETAEIVAVVGRPAPARLLDRVLERPREEVSLAVQHLLDRGVVEERLRDGDVLLQFRHPLTRETLYRGLGLTRRRLLHQQVAQGLEEIHGDAAEDHADEIAFHLTRDGGREADPRTARYLWLAGAQALERHADYEAASYLASALVALGPENGAGPKREVAQVRELLARARTRIGQYREAEAEWTALLSAAENARDPGAQARALRHLGLLAYWGGRHAEALERLDAARELDPPPALAANIELAAGMAYQQLGRPLESRERIMASLRNASAAGSPALAARAHRALALVNTWIGEPAEARRHGVQALELGRTAGDPAVVFWGQWALASLEGLVGGPEPMLPWLRAARATADDLGAPVLGLYVDELELEHAYFRGDWDEALALGTHAIHRARTLNQDTLLVRLLVWTSSVYIGRGDLERAGALVDEACALAGVGGRSTPHTRDVHAAVPALIGRTAVLMASGDVEGALEVGEGALAVAEASGYVIWVLHRLLPLVGEAYIHLRDLEGAERVRRLMVEEGKRMDHRLSLVWATAAQALITWWSGRIEEAAELLREAADAMEEIGICFDAARIRRQLAGRLAELGREEEAAAELRKAHDVFRRLGATREMKRARDMFPEIDRKAPPRPARGGAVAGLSAREAEVAVLVADRLSNKEIAARLDLSVRTVTTHLTNIYKRLELGGSANQIRTLLGDMVREGRIPPPEGE